MKIKTYIGKQNQILEYHLGLTLVPENQIMDIPVTKEMVKNMKGFITTMGEDKNGVGFIPVSPLSMPYCSNYLQDDCTDCPMNGQDNRCELPGSTYNECCSAMCGMEVQGNHISIELIALAKKFIHSNRHLLLDNKEYFNRKNLLFIKHTGMPLVPDDQIVNVPVTAKMVSEMKYFAATAKKLHLRENYLPVSKNNCPYCTLYNTKETEYDCRGCPMDEADNNCKLDDTTVFACEEYLNENRASVPPLALDLIELAKEYIEANEETTNV